MGIRNRRSDAPAMLFPLTTQDRLPHQHCCRSMTTKLLTPTPKAAESFFPFLGWRLAPSLPNKEGSFLERSALPLPLPCAMADLEENRKRSMSVRFDTTEVRPPGEDLDRPGSD